jgi:hypothetical protein
MQPIDGYGAADLVLCRARAVLHPVRFDGDGEREPWIVTVEHAVRNLLDDFAEEEADAGAEVSFGTHREVTVPVAREQLGDAGRGEAPVVAVRVGRAYAAQRRCGGQQHTWFPQRSVAVFGGTARVAAGDEASA